MSSDRRSQNQFIGEAGECPPGDIFKKLLQDLVAAAGVSRLPARRALSAHRGGVAGRPAVEDVGQAGQRLVLLVAGKPVDGQPAAVTQQVADGHAHPGVAGQLPGSQEPVDIGIKVKVAVGDKPQRHCFSSASTRASTPR
jgi:hypothetical protein